MRCLIYTDYIWVWDDASIDIVDMRTFLGGHREVFVDPCKEVLEEVDDGVGTQGVICGASKYHNILGGGFLKVVNIIFYDMLDKS